MKRFLFLIAGLAVILAGVVSFAAFESHIVRIKAHVESATYTTPDKIDFGTMFPEEHVKWCGPSGPRTTDVECSGVDCPPPPSDNCLKIKLSHSFLDQKRVKDVTYDVYCEGPRVCVAGDTECSGDGPAQAITKFIELGKPTEAGDKRLSVNCDPSGSSLPVKWASGKLDKSTGDIEDQWDLTLWAPACKDNYNKETDPYSTGVLDWPEGIPHFVDPCNKGPDPDSYRWVDLAGAIKFQVTGFSYRSGD
jgi:hypothetical protein